MSAVYGGWRTGLRGAAVALSGVVLLGAAYGSCAQIPVTVDEVTVFARPGQTVEGVALEHVSPVAPKVLARQDGRVLARQECASPLIVRNGSPVGPQTRVEWGDEIHVRTRPDVIEGSVTETRVVEAAPRAIGRGVTAKTVVPGVAGIERLTVGAVSGDIIEAEVIAQPQPGLVRMVPAKGTPLVALTFDDGPWPVQTEAVLAILADRDVPATFFMLGSCVERMPAATRAVASAGHAIGNHTYWHVRLDDATPAAIEWEIRSTNRAVERVTGTRPRWLRPPCGSLDAEAVGSIASSGMACALWTVDPQDWRGDKSAEAIADAVVGSVRPGAVVVLHDGGGDRAATIAALPVIIDRLRAAGYEFVTLDELPSVRSSW